MVKCNSSLLQGSLQTSRVVRTFYFIILEKSLMKIILWRLKNISVRLYENCKWSSNVFYKLTYFILIFQFIICFDKSLTHFLIYGSSLNLHKTTGNYVSACFSSYIFASFAETEEWSLMRCILANNQRRKTTDFRQQAIFRFHRQLRLLRFRSSDGGALWERQ